MKNNLFSFPYGDWSFEDFNETMLSLISKGLAEKIIVDNKDFYRFTSIGEIVSKHMNSKSSVQN